MHDLIRRVTHRLHLLFAPGAGAHRAGGPRPHRRNSTDLISAPVGSPRPPLPRSPYCRHLPIDGSQTRLVRPYLTAHEQKEARQQHRRLALVLAADFGIDLDQHLIGAERVAA